MYLGGLSLIVFVRFCILLRSYERSASRTDFAG